MNHNNCPKTKAIVLNGEYIAGCAKCIDSKKNTAAFARKWERERMKENHREDMLQRYDGDKLDKNWVNSHEQKAIDEYGIDNITEVLRA